MHKRLCFKTMSQKSRDLMEAKPKFKIKLTATKIYTSLFIWKQTQNILICNNESFRRVSALKWRKINRKDENELLSQKL